MPFSDKIPKKDAETEQKIVVGAKICYIEMIKVSVFYLRKY